MPFTSKERVLAAFNHDEPDRVPIWCGCSAEFWQKSKTQLSLDDEGLRLRLGDDFRRITAPFNGPLKPTLPGAHSITPFGIERIGLGYGQPMNHPLADATVQDVHDYAWPDPNWVDVGTLRAQGEPYRDQFAILGGDWSPFWHDLIELMGMENMYIRMYTDPEVVEAVVGHLADYYAASSERIFAEAGDMIDIFFIGNDLGSQTGPLLSGPLFQRFILPHLERLIDLGHSHGAKVMLHCCGGFAPLIPAMIRAGLDAVHAVQASCSGMDLRSLKQEFGDKLLFNGAIDSHHILINGKPTEVREKTREVLDIMMPGGGYVAGASHDSILEETPVENILAMVDTVMECGRYGAE